MELTDLIAEGIVNKLSVLLKKKITVANAAGDALASTELSETGKNYEQFQEAMEKGEMEVSGPATKITLGSGLIVPLAYSNSRIGSVFIGDKPEEYNHYRHIIAATVELLIHQNIVTDSFPYKDKIKDNFIFGLLHRRLSVEDSKGREEAEPFDINLNRDKIVVIINPEGFWEHLFGGNLTASEDEKQIALSAYKKKIFQALSSFFGRLAGCSVSYFGSETFVALVEKLYSMDGKEMGGAIRVKAEGFNRLVQSQFEPDSFKRLLIGVGSFYRGKDGAMLAYEEARRALNLALSIGEQRQLYHIDDLGMIATLAGGNKKWQDNFVRRLLVKLLTEEYLLETLEVFFDKNMSLTKTAQQIKIHRNTLLYRLDKIKKVTGLDPRKFNDAMELKVALILNRLLYLEKNKIKQT